MASINPQIDEAVPGDKTRATEFDDCKVPMDEWVAQVGAHAVTASLLDRATDNLRRAKSVTYWARFGEFDTEQAKCLHDVRNLCALALSVLPKECS